MDSLEHVDHVVQVDEGVVDGDHLGPLLQSRPVYQAKIYCTVLSKSFRDSAMRFSNAVYFNL